MALISFNPNRYSATLEIQADFAADYQAMSLLPMEFAYCDGLRLVHRRLLNGSSRTLEPLDIGKSGAEKSL
jgi:hypothetical protein